MSRAEIAKPRDMLREENDVIEFIRPADHEWFSGDRTLRKAALFSISNTGEAVNKISREIQCSRPAERLHSGQAMVAIFIKSTMENCHGQRRT